MLIAEQERRNNIRFRLKNAHRTSNYPLTFLVKAPEVHDSQEVRAAVLDLAKKPDSVDALVIEEESFFPGSHDGFEAVKETGLVESLPIVLITRYHEKEERYETLSQDNFGVSAHAIGGRVVHPSPLKEEMQEQTHYYFKMDEVRPMLRHVDAVVSYRKSTIGDLLEAIKRAINKEFMGSGAYMITTNTVNPDFNFQRSPYWIMIDHLSEAEEFQKLEQPKREDRYSFATRNFIKPPATATSPLPQPKA